MLRNSVKCNAAIVSIIIDYKKKKGKSQNLRVIDNVRKITIMKITLNQEEIQTAVKYQKDRRQYAIDHKLKHLGNIKKIPTNVDQFSVMAEIATAKYLGVEPIMELGVYHTPDMYYHGVPLDVKASFGHYAFAVRPVSIETLPANTLVPYCTGASFYQPPDSIEVDVIGVISHKKVKRECFLSDFNQPERDEAYKVYLHQLYNMDKFVDYVGGLK